MIGIYFLKTDSLENARKNRRSRPRKLGSNSKNLRILSRIFLSILSLSFFSCGYEFTHSKIEENKQEKSASDELMSTELSSEIEISFSLLHSELNNPLDPHDPYDPYDPNLQVDSSISEEKQTDDDDLNFNESIDSALTSANNASLNMISTPTLTLSVTGCASGFSQIYDSRSSGNTIKLYKGDRNCVGKLISFFYEGTLWLPVNGVPFSGPKKALFTNANNKLLELSNPKNLPLGISGAVAISFMASRVERGGDLNLIKHGSILNRRQDNTLDYPNLKIFLGGVRFDGLTAQKTPTFSVTLECGEKVDVLGNCPSGFGQSVNLKDFNFLLVANKNKTYPGGAPNRDLTFARLQKAFGIGGTTWGALIRATEKEVRPSDVGFNGGVNLKLIGDLALPLGGDLAICIQILTGTKTSYTMLNFTFASGPVETSFN